MQANQSRPWLMIAILDGAGLTVAMPGGEDRMKQPTEDLNKPANPGALPKFACDRSAHRGSYQLPGQQVQRANSNNNLHLQDIGTSLNAYSGEHAGLSAAGYL